MSYEFVDFLWGHKGDRFYFQAVTQSARNLLASGQLGPHEHGLVSIQENDGDPLFDLLDLQNMSYYPAPSEGAMSM